MARSARAVPAGSGFTSLTLCWTTVRSPSSEPPGSSSPPKSADHATTGSNSAHRAVYERRGRPPTSSTGTARPSQGRNVSSRLPRWAEVSGTAEWKTSSRAVSTATDARTRPRPQLQRAEPPPLVFPMPCPVSCPVRAVVAVRRPCLSGRDRAPLPREPWSASAYGRGAGVRFRAGGCPWRTTPGAPVRFRCCRSGVPLRVREGGRRGRGVGPQTVARAPAYGPPTPHAWCMASANAAARRCSPLGPGWVPS